MGKAVVSKNRKVRNGPGIKTYIWKHKYLYLMLVPAIVYYIIFCYVPMYGVTIAFKDFNPMKGIMRSSWVGFETFQKLFSMEKFYSVFWNTIRISLIRLIFGFPFPIIIALMLNELRHLRMKKVIQTAIYIPNFISWVVLGGILTSILSMDSGIVNGVIKSLGFQPIGFLTDEKFFVPTMVVSMIWKTFGWNTIIYLAAITGIDTQLYEAATVDGANRWKQVWHVTLPGLKGTIITMVLLAIGRMFYSDFGLFYQVPMRSGLLSSVTDTIDVFVYKGLTQLNDVGRASAAGFLQSVLGFVLVLTANFIVRKVDEDSALF